MPPPVLIQYVLVGLVVVCAFVDMKTGSIPNRLTMGGIVTGLLLNLSLGSWSGLWTAVAGVGLAGLIFMPAYFGGHFGAGAVKLMAAIGALAGPRGLLVIVVLSTVCGLLLGLMCRVFGERVRRPLTLINILRPSDARGCEAKNEETARISHAFTATIGTLLMLWVSQS